MVSDSTNKMDWSIQDSDWIIDANTIDYVENADPQSQRSPLYLSFDFLREEIGLNISREISARAIVPHHLTTASDVFCNREVNMQQIKAVGFDMVIWTELKTLRFYWPMFSLGLDSRSIYNRV